MSKFSALIVKTGIDFPIDNNTAADSGSERDHNCGIKPLRRAGLQFAVSRRIGVVFDVNRLIDTFSYQLAQRRIMKTKICRQTNNACSGIDGAGGTDTDPYDFVHRNTGVRRSHMGSSGHIVCNLSGGMERFRAHICPSNNIIVFVNNTNRNICTAEINSHIISHAFSPPFKICCGRSFHAQPLRTVHNSH